MARLFVANAKAQHVAEIGLDYALSGTVSEGYGFGDWGVEPTAIVELPQNDAEFFAGVLLSYYPKEKCIHVINDDGQGLNIYRSK